MWSKVKLCGSKIDYDEIFAAIFFFCVRNFSINYFHWKSFTLLKANKINKSYAQVFLIIFTIFLKISIFHLDYTRLSFNVIIFSCFTKILYSTGIIIIPLLITSTVTYVIVIKFSFVVYIY